MKSLAMGLLVLWVACSIGGCVTQTGTAERHESVALSFFVEHEGEFVFCIPAPDPNPFGTTAEPMYVQFQDSDYQLILYKLYDPIHFGLDRGLRRLTLASTIAQLDGYGASRPFTVDEIWKHEHLAFETEHGNPGRFANPVTERHGDRDWLRAQVLRPTNWENYSGSLGKPGFVYSTVIWDRYLLKINLQFLGDEKDADAYLQERMWILHKPLKTLKVGKTPEEDVVPDCSA